MFRRKTFPELYEHPEKIMLPMVGDIRAAFDAFGLLCNHGIFVCVPWSFLKGVRNRSIKKFTRYKGEKPTRPDLPRREDLEENSRRLSVKYLLGVLNSQVAREFLKANRRNNLQLYPDDWKKLPIPDVLLEKQVPIITLVDQILDLKKEDPSADVSALEQNVDAMVTKLYGVAPAGPTTVEERAK